MPVEIQGLDRLGGALALFIRDLNIDAKVVVQQTARQLASDFVLETPPFIQDLNSGQTGIVSNKKVAKDTGIAAIRHDLLNCVTPVSEVFDKAFKNKYVEKLIKNKNAEGLQKFVRNNTKLRDWRVVPFSPHLHTDQRKKGNRYRIDRSLKQMTFDERDLRRYQQILEKRVGYSKAGWGFTVAALGGKVASWIAKHFSYCKGQVQVNIDNPANPSVEFSNSTRGITNYISRYNFAIQLRGDKMLKDYQAQVEYNLRKAALN